MFLRLLCRAPAHDDRFAAGGPALARDTDGLLAAEILAGERLVVIQDLFQWPLGHDFTAMNAGTGADFEDVVRRPNRVGVVLDHDHGIAQIAQTFQRLDHLDVVFGMEPDAGLVEDVQHSHKPDPICDDSRIRCDSPPERVEERRFKLR